MADLDALARELARPRETWHPEPGHQLLGEVLDVGEVEGDYGEYPLVHVLAPDGIEYLFHASSIVASKELARQKPLRGDTIGIQFNGHIGPPKPKGYDHYTIRVIRGFDGADTPLPDTVDVDEAARAEADDIPF